MRTNTEIIVAWLQRQLSQRRSVDIASHEVEAIASYARDYHFKTVLASTISRQWRKLREDGSLGAFGLRVIDVSEEYPHRSENTWRVSWQVSI